MLLAIWERLKQSKWTFGILSSKKEQTSPEAVDQSDVKQGEMYITKSPSPLDEEQYRIFQEKAIEAYMRLVPAASSLGELDVELLQATVSVKVPGAEYPKIITLASPNLHPEALRQLLETLGRDARLAVTQSQTIIQLVIYNARKAKAEECLKCPDREECDHRVENETVN